VLIPVATALGLAGAVACGKDAVGVDACRQIETARCENANSCGIGLSMPVHRGDSPGLDVGACKRYYQDACLHGFVVTEDPGSVKVQECVNVINDPNTSCDVVRAPGKSPSCAFLLPPATTSTADAATTD